MATINYEYGDRPIYTLSQAMGEFLFATVDEDTHQIVKRGRDLGDKYTAVELFKAYMLVGFEGHVPDEILGPLNACTEIKDIFMFLDFCQKIGRPMYLAGWADTELTVEDALSILEPKPAPPLPEHIVVTLSNPVQEGLNMTFDWTWDADITFDDLTTFMRDYPDGYLELVLGEGVYSTSNIHSPQEGVLSFSAFGGGPGSSATWWMDAEKTGFIEIS